MSGDHFPYVDSAVGGLHRRNNVIRLADYAPNGHVECFTTFLRFPESFRAHAEHNAEHEGKPSVKGYSGVAKADFVPLDYDAEADPNQALEDVQHSVRVWEAKYDLPPKALRVYFSGGKGFHLEIPAELFGGLKPSKDVARKLKTLAIKLAEDAESLDTDIYDTVRLWRTPNTRHGRTGLYKIPINIEELFGLDLEAIKELAKRPRTDFAYPEPEDYDPVPVLVDLRRAIEEGDFEATEQSREPIGVADVLKGIPKGKRDKTLFKTSAKLRGVGVPYAFTRELILKAASNCNPPFAEDKAIQKVDSAYKRYKPNAELRVGAGKTADGVHGILLSEVVPERVRWLWEGRIALGKLNLVDGDPGTGKSAATTDLAARVSVGKPWPDGSECEAGGVVILSAEDGLADTIRPRFDAAGGDPSRAVAVSTVPDAEGNERQIAIPDDLHVIEAAIERVGAVLVIVDPLMAFLPGEVNSHRDQDVRRALAPLARLAERTGAAIVVVRHLNKGTGGNALYRGGGSIGIVGAARSGLLIAKHPEDDGRRVLASIKSNLAPPAPSLVFSLSGTESGAVRVDWKGKTDLDAAALLSAPTDHEERSTLAEAQEFLREVLADGPAPAKETQEEARSAGVTERTLKRARQTLGVVAERKGEPGRQGGGCWYWTLPHVKGARPKGWPPKPGTDRSDGGNGAYSREKRTDGLRGPNEDNNKGAGRIGPLNLPLSADLGPGESATLEELKVRWESEASPLSVSDVRGQIMRANSGPALALKTYLEKPTKERLEWLTRAVLTARGVDAKDWPRHAGAVKEAAEDPSNHPLDCECEGCV